jgi:branched-subunit amino acid aminotransferase/4-amino-4-deoxychorismate lyase
VTAAQLNASREVIVTASKRIYSAVTQLGERPVGNGSIGPLARRAHAALLKRLREEVAVGAVIASTPILAA